MNKFEHVGGGGGALYREGRPGLGPCTGGTRDRTLYRDRQ